jgi:hypothetical protein
MRQARATRALALFGAFALLTAGECSIGDLGDILDEPGTINVTNVGSEIAVIAILTDDVKSYPTLAGGSSASVKTNVGGAYQVRVVMTPESTAAYRENLTSLRQLVEKQLARTATSAERVQLFIDLAGIKASIQALENQNAAGCSGRIKLEADTKTSVTATVSWMASSGAGFWDTTCGSS